MDRSERLNQEGALASEGNVYTPGAPGGARNGSAARSENAAMSASSRWSQCAWTLQTRRFVSAVTATAHASYHTKPRNQMAQGARGASPVLERPAGRDGEAGVQRPRQKDLCAGAGASITILVQMNQRNRAGQARGAPGPTSCGPVSLSMLDCPT